MNKFRSDRDRLESLFFFAKAVSSNHRLVRQGVSEPSVIS